MLYAFDFLLCWKLYQNNRLKPSASDMKWNFFFQCVEDIIKSNFQNLMFNLYDSHWLMCVDKFWNFPVGTTGIFYYLLSCLWSCLLNVWKARYYLIVDKYSCIWRKAKNPCSVCPVMVFSVSWIKKLECQAHLYYIPPIATCPLIFSMMKCCWGQAGDMMKTMNYNIFHANSLLIVGRPLPSQILLIFLCVMHEHSVDK